MIDVSVFRNFWDMTPTAWDAFVEQGYERRTYHNTRGYIVVLRTGEEMRMIRHLMAHDSTAETKNETDTHTDDTDVS
jgi:hypothetical protein